MARNLRITGLVQGVGYRAAFASRAQALNLSGWVRNRRDGSVEALVCGDVAAIDQIIAWARRGPPGAHVNELKVNQTDDPEQPSQSFAILPTA